MSNLTILENGIIPIYQDGNGQVADARELHNFLGIKRQFADWIKDRIEKYGFVENEDYVSLSQKCEGNNATRIDYYLTIDTAKEIAMVENNKKGKEARRYFIEVEKKLKGNLFPKLSKELQAIFTLDAKTQQIEERVDKLESNMPLFNIECKELQSLVKKIGVLTLGGKDSAAYKDNSLRGKVYSDIQHQLKREFGVHRYEAINRNQLGTARKIVEEYKAPTILINDIHMANSQVRM